MSIHINIMRTDITYSIALSHFDLLIVINTKDPKGQNAASYGFQNMFKVSGLT